MMGRNRSKKKSLKNYKSSGIYIYMEKIIFFPDILSMLLQDI